MKIDYAITTHNEAQEFQTLLNTLLHHLTGATYDFEIVVVDDNSTDQTLLDTFAQFGDRLKVKKHELGRDFAAHKNYLSSQCDGDIIFNLDADELPPQRVVQHITNIFASNPDIEVYQVPRLNTVHGITQRHLDGWGWKLSSLPNIVKEELINTESLGFDLLMKHDLIVKQEVSGENTLVKYKLPIVNWPDFQMRMWRNLPHIKWEKPVHEVLGGYKTIGKLPEALEFAILHHKTIQKQEQQNAMYARFQG